MNNWTILTGVFKLTELAVKGGIAFWQVSERTTFACAGEDVDYICR